MNEIMNKTIRVLHLEDSPRDAELVQHKLEVGGLTCDIVLVDGKEGFESAVAKDSFDVILCDYSLPGYNGKSALKLTRERHPLVPVIIISGTLGEDEAVECLKLGATDYLLKHRLERLASSVQRALQEAEERRAHLKAEELLRASEERFQQIAQHLGEWVWEVDADGLYTYSSPVVENILGYRPEELVGKRHYYDLFSPAAMETLKQATLEHFLSKLPFVRFHNQCAHRDGRIVLLETNATPMLDEQRQLLGYRGVDKDITEQNRLQAQLLRSQRLEAIGTLASGIAHDLNNILAPVLMTTPMLRSAVLDPDSLEILNTIEGCVSRGADVLKQLLSFARGKPGERVPLPLRHLVRDLGMIIRETFPRNIRMVVNIPAILWPMQGDATQLYQVLMNLCINARDAMPDGGMLTIEAANIIVDDALASATPNARPGSYVCVRVSDTGTGIAPENLNRIFEAFFTTKEIGKGTGLGLSTVLGIVRGHEGFVRVNSKLGHGTTFELYFPASPEAKPAETAPSKTPPPRGQGEMVLVVDDEPSMRNTLRCILEINGYRVALATQGAEGVEVFCRHRAEIRAVIADIMMPVMNGPSMIAALKQMEPRLAVLGITGLPEQAGATGLKNLDIQVLCKPFSDSEVLQALRHAIETSGAKDTE